MSSQIPKRKYLKKWIRNIVKNPSHTELSVKKHIIHHAEEVINSEPKKWAASMRNLLEIYEGFYKIRPSVNKQLERLLSKFIKNPLTHTPPPRR